MLIEINFKSIFLKYKQYCCILNYIENGDEIVGTKLISRKMIAFWMYYDSAHGLLEGGLCIYGYGY